MQPRKNKTSLKHGEMFLKNFSACYMMSFFSTSSVEKFKNVEMPSKRRMSERKPLVTGINDLKRRERLQKEVRQEVQEIILRPPANGMLVKRLVPVAHEVFAAWAKVTVCISKITKIIPIHRCSLCGEVHVGLFPHQMHTCNVRNEHRWEKGGIHHILPLVESFHLYDRVGRAVSHEERLQVDRVPAISELCIQAGVDIPEYPTKRRAFPVYNISGKIVDFERKFPQEYSSGKNFQTSGFWERRKETSERGSQALACDDDLQGLAIHGMEAWEKMRLGALKLMEKYPVQTCGYCPEVQVGPKGHRVRLCQAYKHQMRDGQHAWQEATFDDLVPPVYVWHVPDPHSGSALVDSLRKYYGKLPAVVELFAQAGASVGEAYATLMREDVAVPEMDEEKWVV